MYTYLLCDMLHNLGCVFFCPQIKIPLNRFITLLFNYSCCNIFLQQNDNITRYILFFRKFLYGPKTEWYCVINIYIWLVITKKLNLSCSVFRFIVINLNYAEISFAFHGFEKLYKKVFHTTIIWCLFVWMFYTCRKKKLLFPLHTKIYVLSCSPSFFSYNLHHYFNVENSTIHKLL